MTDAYDDDIYGTVYTAFHFNCYIGDTEATIFFAGNSTYRRASALTNVKR